MTRQKARESGKKVFIKTYGCQMNVYDSERMGDALERDGYESTDRLEDADLVLLNTCHIREKAAEKVYSELGRIRKIKEAAPAERPMMIGVTGCVAQAQGEEIIARDRAVDLVIGPQSYHHLPRLARKARSEGPQVAVDFAVQEKFEEGAPSREQIKARGVSAFLTIQEGCDKFCAFCVVPYTRGAEVSRPREQILAEAERLVAAGVREITLLGQNVNAWRGYSVRGAQTGLGGLLRELAALPDLARLRYTTSHPKDMDDELIAAHKDVSKLMPYLHLPVQSGSDAILKAMNRRHKAQDYLKIIAKVRRARPDIAISGDFIVGFPGETDADFEDTLALAREVGYAQCFSFKYSPRPGTPGALMEKQVPEPVKRERLARLQELLADSQRAFNESLIGKRTIVLLEKPGREPNQRVGRSPWLQSVIVPESAGEIGELVEVTITQANPNSLSGEPCADESCGGEPRGRGRGRVLERALEATGAA